MNPNLRRRTRRTRPCSRTLAHPLEPRLRSTDGRCHRSTGKALTFLQVIESLADLLHAELRDQEPTP